MRRIIALFMTITVLMLCTANALAMTMAGWDDSSAGHTWETNGFFRRMEENTGLSFSFAQYDSSDAWTAAKQAMLNGGELPDVLFKADLTVSETLAFHKAGLLTDLAPLIEAYAPNLNALLNEHPQWRDALTLDDGAIVALPTFSELQTDNAMWINRSWLDNLGLSVPATADELTEVLRAFRDGDPNGNGKKDEIPLTFLSLWDLKFLGHAFGLVSDDYSLYLEDGEVRSTLTDDRNRAFLTWLSQLWSEGLLSEEGFTGSDTYRAITDSNAAITFGVMLAPTPLSLIPAAGLSQYQLLEPLKDADGRQQYRAVLSDVTRGTFAVTAACSDPAAVLQWVDTLYTEDGMMLAYAGLEGVEYERRSDGTWGWIASDEEVYNTIRPAATIMDGTAMPGLITAEYQLAYDNDTTHSLISALSGLKQYTKDPMPLYYLTDEQQTRVDEIQAKLGREAELAMTWFVTGEVALTDESWQTFREQAEANGLSELIRIISEAVR